MAGESEVYATLSNLQVLYCKVCNQPSLTIPVYQCKNGHTACVTCCDRLDHKCATCGLEIDSRCRHLEEILQSLKLPCQNKGYGCEELISYRDIEYHAKSCAYECYPCQEPACQFKGLSSQLSDHIFAAHSDFKVFNYKGSIDLELGKNQKTCVLKEAASGDVFVLSNEPSPCCGNKISVSFVSPTAYFPRHEVEVKVSFRRGVFTFCGSAPIVRNISDKSEPPETLLHIPSVFVWLEDSFSINLKIKPITF